MAADLNLTLNGTPVPVYLGENTAEAARQAQLAAQAATEAEGYRDEARDLVVPSQESIEKVSAATYTVTDAPEGGLPSAGASAASVGVLHLALSAAATADGPLNSFSVRIQTVGDGDGVLCLASISDGTVTIEAAWPAELSAGE